MIAAIVALFILVIIAFAVILLLYMKVSQLKGLEKKQQIMMREMDQLVSAYLVEMREENDRLLGELQQTKPKSIFNEPVQPVKKPVAPYVPPIPEEAVVVETTFDKPVVPKNVVTNAYMSQPPKKKKKSFDEALQQAVPIHPPTSEVHALAAEGKSIEEIARALGKGKTEVELLLKFRA